MVNYGILCGRFNPIHVGHEANINWMLDNFGIENSRLIVGSANSQMSIRHFYSYEERRGFIKTIYPDIKIMPLSDFFTDDEWMLALDDLLQSSGIHPELATFYGGCEEDIEFFIKRNRHCKIINRFDGTTPKISASEVRDALIYKRDVDDFLNPLIKDKVVDMFNVKWSAFQKR
jgi:nicotinic acid mononucleotide adenylyltransferase